MPKKPSRRNAFTQDGEKLRVLRYDVLGLTQPKAADLTVEAARETKRQDVAITKDTVCNYETNRVSPGREKIQLYLDVLESYFVKLDPIEQEEMLSEHGPSLLTFRAVNFKQGTPKKDMDSTKQKEAARSRPDSITSLPKFTIVNRSVRKKGDWETIELIDSASHRLDLLSEVPTKVLGPSAYEHVLQSIANGCVFRVVVLDPLYITEESNRKQIGAHNRYFSSVGDAANAYRGVLDGLEKLEQAISNDLGYSRVEEVLEVRGWKGSIPFGLLVKDAVDEPKADSRCRVEMRLHNLSMQERPSLLLRPADSPWYQVFVDQFQSYWDACEGNRIEPVSVRKQLSSASSGTQ